MDSSEKPLRFGTGMVAPQLIESLHPEYTEAARAAKIEGRCQLTVVISKMGIPEQMKVELSLDPGLDERAKEAVSRWRFIPAQKEGKPVAVYATIEVNFSLSKSY